MEYYKELLKFTQPSSPEIAQRTAKILLNSCYDRIALNSDFHLYDADSVQTVGATTGA